MRTVFRCLGVILGTLGFILCAASLVGVWTYYPLGKQKFADVYAKLDEALELVGDRIESTQERVVAVNAMTAEFRTNLKEWLTDQQIDREQVGNRTELIAARLHQASDGLDFAESFLQKVRSTQRLAHPFRKETDTEKLDGLLEEIGKLQTRLSGVIATLDEIRQQAEESGDVGQLEEAIEQAIAKTVGVIEIIDSAEDQLEMLSTRVTEARSQAAELEARIQRDWDWLRLAAFIVLPWMALGQIALCIVAWRRNAAPT